MRTKAKELLVWVVDALLGPRCPVCNYRARGHRTLAAHIETTPCGDVVAYWTDEEEESEA